MNGDIHAMIAERNFTSDGGEYTGSSQLLLRIVHLLQYLFRHCGEKCVGYHRNHMRQCSYCLYKVLARPDSASATKQGCCALRTDP